MTNLFFIRHAESDLKIKDDFSRSLTEKGLNDSKRLPLIFKYLKIDYFYSSPYIRSIDTIKYLANSHNSDIIKIENFRERTIGKWLDDFDDFMAYSRKQWNDFNYKLTGGESLKEVQARNIAEINKLLEKHIDQNIVIGTHGTAMSTILNYYDADYGYDDYLHIAKIMPYIIRLEFKNNKYIGSSVFD
jgi:2,3-bisphosphoglycerate-dependent phosphoglycerate mutase